MLAVSSISTNWFKGKDCLFNYIKKKIMQPCRATNQSNVCLIAGLTIFILPEGYNEWLSSLITSLYNEFSIQYGIALLVSSLSYVGSSVHNLTTIP